MIGLAEQARAALSGDPEADAIEFRGQWICWAEMSKVAQAVGNLLEASGAAEGALVGFIPRNRPSAIAAELGMIAARRTIRMIYAFQSATGIARDVGRSELAAVVAAEEDFTPPVLEVIRSQRIAAIALTEMGAHAVDGAERSLAERGRVSSEPQIQIHTSGTTGPPKHVGFTYEMIAKYIIGQNVSSVADENSNAAPVLLTFPLGNISGIYSTLPPMLQRRRAILLDRFTLDGWRDFIRRFQPAMPMLPPAAMNMVLDARVPKEELASIKMIMTGAAPLDPSVQRAFEERYGIPILLSYGATEFGGPVTVMTPELYAEFGASKLGTVGRPFAGSKLRVVDPATSAELPAGKEGLLEVIAPRIGPDWIRTSDVALIDEDGFLFHRGRADGAIVRGGFKLLPEVIERALCLHPDVSAAVVVGINDQRLDQAPAAAVQVTPGRSEPSIAELEQHLRNHVYATHIPVAWKFIDEVPRNKSVKIDLPAVRELFRIVPEEDQSVAALQ